MPADVRWLTDDQQRAWRAYLTGSARLLERLDQDLRTLGLSLPEYEVLVRLSEAPDRRVRMSELADSVHQSRSRLTHTIARMERDGLVGRHCCDADRRGVWAGLTERGWRKLVAVAPEHVRAVRELLVDVVDPEDLHAIDRVFAAVTDRLDGDREGRGRRGGRESRHAAAAAAATEVRPPEPTGTAADRRQLSRG